MHTGLVGLFPEEEHCEQFSIAYSPHIIGSALKAVRRNRGISSYTLALEAAINPSYYSSVENGRNFISVQKLSQLCCVLNLRLSEFFLLVERILEDTHGFAKLDSPLGAMRIGLEAADVFG